MSAFDNYIKDNIVDSIKNFIEDRKEKEPNIQINMIVSEVMEAVSYGICLSIWDIENNIKN